MGPAQPGSQRPSPLGHGLTVEASLGYGWIRVDPDQGDSDSESGRAGPNLGIGGWIAPTTALTVRLAAVQYSDSSGSFTIGFFGGALQQWLSQAVWLGVGAGVGSATINLDGISGSFSESGLGLEARFGVVPFISGQFSVNLSVEANTAFLDAGRISGLGLLIGMQYL